MEQSCKDTLKNELSKMLESTVIDLALIDETGLLLEDHVKVEQISTYFDKVFTKLCDRCEYSYESWYKDETTFDDQFVKNYLETFGILDVLYWFAEAYVTAKYTGYKDNIYVYDYNWEDYSDREFIGIWFGIGQFFDVCELGMVSYGREAWKNKHTK